MFQEKSSVRARRRPVELYPEEAAQLGKQGKPHRAKARAGWVGGSEEREAQSAKLWSNVEGQKVKVQQNELEGGWASEPTSSSCSLPIQASFCPSSPPHALQPSPSISTNDPLPSPRLTIGFGCKREWRPRSWRILPSAHRFPWRKRVGGLETYAQEPLSKSGRDSA